MSQMKQISGSHYLFHLLTNSTSQHVPVTVEMIQVGLFSASVRKYREYL